MLHFWIPDLKTKNSTYVHGKDEIIWQIADQCLQCYPTVNDIDTNDANTSDVEEVHSAKWIKGLATVLQHVAEEDDNVHSVTPLTPLQKIKKEVISCLNYPSIMPGIVESRFPNLAYLAKKCLCICSTSVPSGRAFSHIANNLKNHLTPHNVNKLVFLQTSWYSNI